MPPPSPAYFGLKLSISRNAIKPLDERVYNLKPSVFELYRNREPMDRCEYDTYIGKYSGSGDN